MKEKRETKRILRTICSILKEIQALNPVVLDLRGCFSLADYFVITSGKSDRQVRGISDRILDRLKKEGIEVYSVEGYEESRWVLLDIFDVIVHIFYQPERERYDLESLWIRGKRYRIEDFIEEFASQSAQQKL